MRKLLILMALLLGVTEAHAQATTELCVRATPTGFCQAVNSTNGLPVGGTVTPSPVSTPGCTIGTSSAQCLAGLVTARWLQLQNAHATNSMACSWGGTAVLNAAGSFQLAPGQAASWGLVTGGVPSQALNCIASGAATPMYVEYR